MSNDAPEDRDALVKKLGLDFPVVSDADLALSAAFGVRQEDKEAPLPSIYVLDARGRVAWNAVGDNIVERPSVRRILEAIPRAR